MNLDKKDQRILEVLSDNCRTSLTQLAKKTGVSREVADYRLKKLVKVGIIKSFCTDINIQALGYTKHVVYAELRNVDKKKEQEILNLLKNNKYISWLVTSTGKWSIVFDIHSRNTQHLGELMSELKKSLSNHLGEYQITTLEDYDYFHSKYFNISKTKKKNQSLTKLDAMDLLILKSLSRDAQIDYVKLAKIIKLTPEAISRRIKKLLERDIIKQFYIFPDITKLGFELYNIQIALENITSEKENKIRNYLKNNKSVSFIYKPVSHLNLEFGVFVRNPGELREFIQNLRTLHPESIRIKDVALFYEEVIDNALPDGVF